MLGSSVAGSSGTSLHLHRPVTTESYVRATIDGLKNTGETFFNSNYWNDLSKDAYYYITNTNQTEATVTY